MSAEIIQIRDYQNKKDIERLYAELQPFVDTAPSEMIPYHGQGIDGMDLPDPA
jgi:hypothetical protein